MKSAEAGLSLYVLKHRMHLSIYVWLKRKALTAVNQEGEACKVR